MLPGFLASVQADQLPTRTSDRQFYRSWDCQHFAKRVHKTLSVWPQVLFQLCVLILAKK